VIVIGGGISGLATAFELCLSGADLELRVLEARHSAGGNIVTLRVDDCLVDAGPDAIHTSRPEALALCNDLGLGDRMVAPSSEGARFLVAREGRLEPVPEDLVYGVPRNLRQLASTRLLSWRGRARAALDLVLPGRKLQEISVGELVEQRLGREVKDRLVEPIIAAITASDIDRLDAEIAAPLLARAPRSVIAALVALPRSPDPLFRAPRNGMTELVDALIARIGPERVQLATPARALTRVGSSFRIDVAGSDPIVADDVVVATPAYRASELLEPAHPELSSEIRALRSLSVAAVILGFDAVAARSLPRAAGLLLPRVERRSTIAATFVSTRWPERTASGRFLIRAFVGGDRSREMLAASDASIVSTVLGELGSYLCLPPLRSSRVVRFERSSPSPRVGHRSRIATLHAHVADSGRLHLVGGAYAPGISLASCIAQARETARRILAGRA